MKRLLNMDQQEINILLTHDHYKELIELNI
jgi:hypothetical protein